jgi:hypothetical protein
MLEQLCSSYRDEIIWTADLVLSESQCCTVPEVCVLVHIVRNSLQVSRKERVETAALCMRFLLDPLARSIIPASQVGVPQLFIL